VSANYQRFKHLFFSKSDNGQITYPYATFFIYNNASLNQMKDA